MADGSPEWLARIAPRCNDMLHEADAVLADMTEQGVDDDHAEAIGIGFMLGVQAERTRASQGFLGCSRPYN